MSDLTEGQIAQCMKVARTIIKEVLVEHINTCPHHMDFLITKARFVGLVIGVVVASGVSSGTVVAIIMKVFA